MTDAFTAATQLLGGDSPSREHIIRAAELLEKASCGGHPEASERLAMFEAFGMARPQSWDRALDLLELAARQGSRTAQEQLLLLADNQRDPSAPGDGSDEFWSAVRTRIDVSARTSPAEKTVISETPRIRLIRNFATAAECRWVVANAAPRLTPAMVFGETTGGRAYDPNRDNSYLVVGIDEMNVLTEVIRHRISAATRLPVPLFEASQVLHYSVGQQFKPHHDFLDPDNPAYDEDLIRFGQRIATFLIYLNEGYGGGETSFPEIGLDYRANEGDALFYANVTGDGRPDPLTLHAGLPPTSGEKWVFSQWIRDRFPKA
jgi:prolyl 4-hydroxylase